ncbi:MAG TPA: MoaD/ThiS family protein [Candidatus Limnocylindria bacterium]|jgi:molybdopterin synthase sulfur carrier subunit|nr:MoaD/ThiS family protein [Candidatus Limnocylindria bacterium]
MIQISIPPTLRRFCGDQESVAVAPGTVASAIEQLHDRFNGIRDRLLDPQGNVRGSVLVFVNQEDIRFLQNQLTPLSPGDVVSIIPAFAGG